MNYETHTIAGTQSCRKVVDLEHQFGYHQRVAIHKVILQRLPSKWRLILKGTKNGMSVVAFITGKAAADTLLIMADLQETNAITWFPDRYP